MKEKIFVLESCKSELEAEQKRSKEFEETQVGYNFKLIEHRRWLHQASFLDAFPANSVSKNADFLSFLLEF